MSNEDRSGSVWAVGTFFLAVTWLAVSLRVYVRGFFIKRFGIDDKTCVVAQILFTGYLICQIGGVTYGTGRHLSDLTYANAETALKFWYFCEVWYSVAGAMVRISICLSLRRVTVKPIHLWIIYGLIIWSIALGLSTLLVIIFQCRPTSDWWDLNPEHKRCIASHVLTSLTYASSALNVACDWTLGIFPFFIVKDLAIPLQQKFLVAGILAIGALASTACLIRMFYIPSLEQTYLGWDGDFLYATTDVAVWTTVESGVAITMMCIATLRPLVNHLFGLQSSYTGSKFRSESFSPYVSADRPTTGPHFGSLREARANAMAIIDADEDRMEPLRNEVGFNTFNMTKAINTRVREIEREDVEMGSSSTWSSSKSQDSKRSQHRVP